MSMESFQQEGAAYLAFGMLIAIPMVYFIQRFWTTRKQKTSPTTKAEADSEAEITVDAEGRRLKRAKDLDDKFDSLLQLLSEGLNEKYQAEYSQLSAQEQSIFRRCLSSKLNSAAENPTTIDSDQLTKLDICKWVLSIFLEAAIVAVIAYVLYLWLLSLSFLGYLLPSTLS